ncbi:uncharacterized protein BDV17DRAFT_287381 [Aspergillus undulatus]|uniref:uncharacterized protein n=1 Tax=Aspergillus undulatus TaxID=1810928 RepID=UPI003CCD50F5
MRDNVRIFLEWRNGGMSMEHAKSIVTLFRNLLTKVLSPQDIPVRDLNLFTDTDMRRIDAWNGPPLQMHDRLIHDVIREQVLLRPHDEAICAWDGSLTYEEFDRRASRLAYYLQEQGVGPEILVPLCFDKSVFYFVAVLAVLKAGGAFVPLDPSHPSARLESLIERVNASLVLCSEQHLDRLLPLCETVIPLSQTTFDQIPAAPVDFISSDEVDCSNAAYVIFTSGSTGEPKGTFLEHRAYCSSALVHGPRLLISPESRVLQFAAHTFDASLAESISPFMHGACVCIPSEHDRLNDIVGAITRLRVNYASLTPSFIEFIQPSMIPEVKTLVLAGEAMNELQRDTWSTINLVNGFGPTEASVTAAINSNVTAKTDCRDIGQPMNARCWIVDPNDHNYLAPVGGIGEMLLEGPTLARGYINDPQKTAEVFIHDPGFVKQSTVLGQSGRRFYKTGDLVRYNSDLGSLTYIGRKDSQVKLHGQRVELGEVEGCLNTNSLVKHCVVLVPKGGYAKGKLTAVLSVKNDDGREGEAVPLDLLNRGTCKEPVMALREALSTRLPKYMVPAIWLCVDGMPFLPSRKLDRKGVLTWVNGLDQDPYRAQENANSVNARQPPASEVEYQLVEVWSRLLNIPAEQVLLNESFLKLGGDSIAAMSCMNLCKKQGIAVTVQDILQTTSIRDLAVRAQRISATHVDRHEERIEEEFDLSPIQALHFKVRQEGQGHFNQSIRTRLNQRMDPTKLRQAIHSLVSKHSMLRARFAKSAYDGKICQRITNDVPGSFRWTRQEVDSEDQIDALVAPSQSSLSMLSGPLLAVDLFDVRGGKQVLSLIAHHLVVDIVSWRVILEDLEDFLTSPSGPTNPSSSLPFQTWLELQHQNSAQAQTEERGLEHLPPPDLNYWGLIKQQIVYGDVDCASFSLDGPTTSVLMSDCHGSLRTEPVDVILAAMAFSFGQTFSDRPLPVIYNEGHGREPWDTSIDISRTVGWFTTLYPIFIDKPKDEVDAVIRVKDRRRQTSDNGRSCFARRALLPESNEQAHDCPMEINLNYLGQHRDLQRTDGLFQLADRMAGETRRGGHSADFGRETPRFSLFEVSATVVQGRLRVIFSFSASMKRKLSVQQWVQSCQQVLESLAMKLPSLPPQLTLSDFPLMSLEYPELLHLSKKLLRYGVCSIDDLEDIYPCSKMQQGVLVSQARDPMLYAVSGTWRLDPSPGAAQPDLQRLIKAWNKVVEHHAMLRTVFATGLCRRHPFSHVVLRKFTSPPVLLRSVGDENIITTLDAQGPADYKATRPAHRFTLCQSDTGTIVCRIEISHAAMDGISISLLLRDMKRAYEDELDQRPKPLFKDYIHHLYRRPVESRIDHWCAYLSGLQPCHLPSDVNSRTGRKRLQTIQLPFDDFVGLQSFCSSRNLTVANAFKAAWGLTLVEFCQLAEVCFSYITSLRDAPVSEIENIVGPVMTLLPCRLRLKSQDVVDILHQVQDDYMEVYAYRDVSLIDIHHAMNLSRTPLFNSGVSYRKLPSTKDSDASIRMQRVGPIHDPAEVSVYVNVEATDTEAHLELNYWSDWLSDEKARKVGDCFLRILGDITKSTTSEPSETDSLGPKDILRVTQWNSFTGSPPRRCIHAAIESQALQTPNRTAIVTENLELTYAHLHELSSALASYLVKLGLFPGATVPIGFNQLDTMLAIISILAIWKAGGICLPLESELFSNELEAWMPTADIQLGLSSPDRAASLEQMSPFVIPVTYDFLEALETDGYHGHESALTESAYVAFSTQLPTGVMLDHAAVASSCSSLARAMKLDSDSRVLRWGDLASYEFLMEAFGTLSRGGCLCAPRQYIKDNITNTTSKFRVTAMLMDASVASSTKLSGPSELQLLAVTGGIDGLQYEQLQAHQVQLTFLFGGLEYSPVCFTWSGSKSILAINAPGVKTWIVDPTDHNTLLPVGAVGELVIEGPALARGYIFGKPENDCFIENPTWISLTDNGTSKADRRMFKTGELVQYTSDGSLHYAGRKSGSSISRKEDSRPESSCPPITENGVDPVQDSSGTESPVSSPCLKSQASFSSVSVLEDETPSLSKRSAESRLKKVWAEVLDIEPSSVSTDESFFSLGGDSFTAMRLVSEARADGLSISVADVSLTCPSKLRRVLPPFTLLPQGTNLEDLLDKIAKTCRVPKSSICDVYPCSALQEGLITASNVQPGAYVASPVFKLARDVDIRTFKAAWQRTVEEIEVLRTRVLHTAAAKFVQAVLKPTQIEWDRSHGKAATRAGGPLTGYKIANNGPSRIFTWSIHHSLYDGWSVPLVLQAVEKNYKLCQQDAPASEEPSTVPYSVFIDHLENLNLAASDNFWRTYLENLSSPVFPDTKKEKHAKVTASSRHFATTNVVPQRKDATLPELIRAAWAMIISLHTESGDVCFGETLMGRNIDVPGATNIAGPLLTTVPTRIAVDSAMKVTDFLHRVHQSAAAIIPHQHAGLQRIRKVSKDAAAACNFQNLLVIQTAENERNSDIWVPESIEANHDFFTYPLTRIISTWHIERLVGQFSAVLNQLAATKQTDDTLLSDLELVCAADTADLARWNQEPPTCVDRTIHDLINDQRLLQPNAPAVASWDGNLSYEELLDSAQGMAGHLSDLGIGPEVLVPVCMDKSVWIVVTIMSILIAGGAFVPLDPAHPISRHEEILEETGAKFILCTPKYFDRYTGKVPSVLAVDRNTVQQHRGRSHITPRRATSTNVAYSIFTSGSTGKPKGIIIEHRAFVTSTMAYGPIIHLKPGIRVFQFASLTFDAAVMEILGTLIFGGCVCIPSDEERLNDIAGAIRRLDVSWLFCTPSLAGIINPSSVPSLKVIVCGGELMSHEAMVKWSDKVHFINAYGPTETSVYATFNPHIGRDRNPANIGKPIPSTRAWIVDPENHDRLYPIGAVGELALEGPVLAREYLKNPEKTAKAFVTNPKWANAASSGQSDRRIYLSGDLARFTADGSLEYVGRKDNQVKLHGQRMELGEIEYRLHENPHVRHVVVILPKSGRLRGRLVAILSLNSLSAGSNLISSTKCSLVEDKAMENQGMTELMQVQSCLDGQLPPYMVPQTWAVVESLPMLVSGKIDRKRITNWIETVDDGTYNRVMTGYDRIKRGKVAATKATTQPTQDHIIPKPPIQPMIDETESLFSELVAHVLNVPVVHVDLGRSFTSLGGDSITGMALISHARKRGLKLSLITILQASSMKELATAAKQNLKQSIWVENSDSWFGLSAIQQFYFQCATQFKGAARFNQSITLRLPCRVEPSVIANGLKAIVQRHPMLRARFRQANGKWEQKTLAFAPDCFRFNATHLQEEEQLKREIAMTQNSIDIINGPVFASNLFEIAGGNQIMFLVTNHLCIDMVSWRIILQDLEEFVTLGRLTPETPFRFQSWCDMQAEHCEQGDHDNHLPFSLPPQQVQYWGMKDMRNAYGDVSVERFSLGVHETALALDKCHTSLRTEPLDLFLAVIMQSFRRTFTDRQVPVIFNETHGRHPWDNDIDLSGTVGWFTSMCPLHLELDSDDILDTLRMVKEARRKIINYGSSFFAQNVLAPENRCRPLLTNPPFEILFNYLGKLQQLERKESLFQHYGRLYDEQDLQLAGDMGPETPRFALFEISAIVIRDQLQFSFTFNSKMAHQAQIRSWISECEMTLHEASDILQHGSRLEVMPSDYPLLSISQGDLQTIFTETLPKLGVRGHDAIEDIYPCSSMQEGILFSQLRDPSAYMLHTIFNVRDSRNQRPISIPRLRKAWQLVVNRHPILRTIFIDSTSKNGSFNQVVLKNLPAHFVELECENSNISEQLNKVSLDETNRTSLLKKLSQVTVCKSPSGTAVMKLELNHAIIDGSWFGLLLRELSLAYERKLPPQPGPSHRDFIEYLNIHPQEEGIEFWTRYLHSVQPCHIPTYGHGPRELKSVKMDFDRFPELRQLSQRESVTLANLILAGWAIVLREFTGSQDVCFGYLSAGRDVPVPGIQDAVGIFINMLCCRVQFSQHQSLAETYRNVQNDFFRSIPYQSCSLATIQNELGLDGQMLFNTALSIQNHVPSAGSEDGALSFEIQEAYDPSEFPVTVNAVTARGAEGILLRYWSDVISDVQANHLVAGLGNVFTTLIEAPTHSVSTFNAIDNTRANQPNAQPEPQISLRRRGSVRSRRSRFSISDPLIQQKIDERVNEILSQLLKKDLAAMQGAGGNKKHMEADELPISPISRLSSVHRRSSTISRISRRRMSMDLEGRLLVLWATALGVSADSIDRQDSFFSIGGDSIKAMKMASSARDEGLVLTVADVFRNPVFEDMLVVICSTSIVHTVDTGSIEPIKENFDGTSEDVTEIVDEIVPSGTISPQSLNISKIPVMQTDLLQGDICPKIGFFKGAILDVLPVTDFQALSLTAQLFQSRWMLNYFYLDGEGQLDLKRLRESCARVIDAFDILRTVFVCSGDSFYQVVLKKVKPVLTIYETHMDLDAFTASLQQRDREQDLRQGEQFVHFAVVKRSATNQNRILIRLSHAQYDGMCISRILDALKQGYEGGTLSPTTSFASYMRYQGIGSYTEVKATVTIAQSSTIGNITVATLVQAAWALSLARLSADADVVFGMTVNGRNASIPGVQDTVGPCLNMVPVRVTFGNRWTALDLIRHLQDQLVATMPYESLGFREIIERCTDWPSSTYFSTTVLHQNVDFEGHMDLDNYQYRVGGAGVLENLADLALASRSVGTNQINLSLGYNSKGPITGSLAARVLQLVSDTIVTISSNPTTQLPSPNTLRSLPPQTIPDLPRVPDDELLTSQLKSQNISDVLVHSAILSRTWQQVLPARQSNKETFQLDTCFYDLGGDIFAIGQATWLLQQEGYQVRIEDLLDRPTFLGHMSVLAQDTMNQHLKNDIVNDGDEKVTSTMPLDKIEKRVRWKKAFGIMGKFSKRAGVSS